MSGSFHKSIKTLAGSGSPDVKVGLSINHYSFDTSMTPSKTSMYSADGDMLIVPQTGTLLITTEFGKLSVAPKEVVIIPRGVKFSIDLAPGEKARGWMTECY